MSIIAGEDENDATMAKRKADSSEVVAQSKPLKIAYINDCLNNKGLDPQIKASTESYIQLLKDKIQKLRELSPLWEMFKDGIDISKVEWAAH